jgi:Calx-beta domain.
MNSKKTLRTLVIAASALFASFSHADTSVIDVAFYVSPDAVNTYGKEVVHNSLMNQISLANTAYQSSGSDVTFAVKEIYTATDGTFDSFASASSSGLQTISACVSNLEAHAGLISPGLSGQFSFNDVTCNQVFPDQASGVSSEMGQLVLRTGADWVFVVTSDYHVPNSGNANIGDASGKPVGAAIAMKALTEYPNMPLVAHEMGHLLGLADRYAQSDTSLCTGNNANSLMCVASNVDVTGTLPLFGGAETFIDPTNVDTTPYTTTTANDYFLDFSNEKMTIARSLMNISPFYYTNNVSSIGADLQEHIAEEAMVKLTASTSSITVTAGATVDYTVALFDRNDLPYAATTPVSVEIYTKGVSAKSGVDYNAEQFIQTVTFAPGESTKTISLPIIKAGFNGSRDLYIGIRNGNGIDIYSSAAQAYLLIIDSIVPTTTDSDTASDSSSDSSGGGSFDFYSIVAMALLLTLRFAWLKKKQS